MTDLYQFHSVGGSMRTWGSLPVSEHLRPSMRHKMDCCPHYQRLDKPSNRATWRFYDVVDYIPISIVVNLPIVGEA